MRQGFLIGAVVLACAAPAAAATIENFHVKTTRDFVALCDASPNSEHYVAAVNFCEGYAVGAFQYYQAQTLNSPANQFVCLPSPPPSRDEAIAAYVAWVKANPQYLEEAAVDTIFRYLAETYPCKP